MAQPQLNGAYYGPSIPPPPKSHRRQAHNDSSGGCGICSCFCGCFRCCFGCIANCILGLICKILTTILIIAAVAGFLFWLIVRPNVIKFRVTEAALTEFAYTNNNTLHYNLALNVTVRNPNRRVGIYYDSIETTAFYHDARFGSQILGNFFQHHKNTSVLSPVFKGQQVVPLSEDQGKKLDEEKGSGIYHIDVRMMLKVRFKLGLIKTGKVKPKVRCDLQVPLKSRNGTASGTGFQATDCDLKYYRFWFH